MIKKKIKEVNQLVYIVNEIIIRTDLFMRLYIIFKYNYIDNKYDKETLFNNQEYYNYIKEYVNGINSIRFDEKRQ